MPVLSFKNLTRRQGTFHPSLVIDSKCATDRPTLCAILRLELFRVRLVTFARLSRATSDTFGQPQYGPTSSYAQWIDAVSSCRHRDEGAYEFCRFVVTSPSYSAETMLPGDSQPDPNP